MRLDQEAETPGGTEEKPLFCSLKKNEKLSDKDIRKMRIILDLIDYFKVAPEEARRMFEAMESGFFCANL